MMSDYIYDIQGCEEQVETGPIQFGEDWPGAYIRGEQASIFAESLKTLINPLSQNVDKKDITTLIELRKIEGLQATLSRPDVQPSNDHESSRDQVVILPAQQNRVETMVIKIANDAPGIFIRGDDAGYQALTLKRAIGVIASQIDEDDETSKHELDKIRSLQKILASCVTGPARAMLDMAPN